MKQVFSIRGNLISWEHRQGLVTFLRGRTETLQLASREFKSGILLTIPQCTGKSFTTKNYLVQNFNSIWLINIALEHYSESLLIFSIMACYHPNWFSAMVDLPYLLKHSFLWYSQDHHFLNMVSGLQQHYDSLTPWAFAEVLTKYLEWLLNPPHVSLPLNVNGSHAVWEHYVIPKCRVHLQIVCVHHHFPINVLCVTLSGCYR